MYNYIYHCVYYNICGYTITIYCAVLSEVSQWKRHKEGNMRQLVSCVKKLYAEKKQLKLQVCPPQYYPPSLPLSLSPPSLLHPLLSFIYYFYPSLSPSFIHFFSPPPPPSWRSCKTS